MRARSAWRRGSLAAGFAALLLLSGMARADAALNWLNRAATAAKQQNYSGVYVYHHGEHVEVLRVLHRIDATGELEKVEVLDGTPRKFLRVNNDVYCHLPDGKSVRLERNALRRFFPALLPAQPVSLLGVRLHILVRDGRFDLRTRTASASGVSARKPQA